MAIWIVRGGSHGDDAEQDFLETESVGIYFGVDQTLDGLSDGVLRGKIEEFCIWWAAERGVQFQSRVVTWFFNQVLNFRDGIRRGDTVVMPRKASGGHGVARGTVASGYEYWGPENYRHRRRVQWLETDIPRESIGYDWAPSDRRTVFRIDGG